MLDAVAMDVPRVRDLDHKRATGTLRTVNFRGAVAGLGAFIPAGSFWTQDAGAVILIFGTKARWVAVQLRQRERGVLFRGFRAAGGFQGAERC